MSTALNAPANVGLSLEEAVFATRYRQGGRTVYGLNLTPSQVISLILRPNPDAPATDNRRIRPRHAEDFAHYYLNAAPGNEVPKGRNKVAPPHTWVIPPLILRAPSMFTFTDEQQLVDGTDYGILRYPKSRARDIQILDGQHRILGFHVAYDIASSRLTKAKDHRGRAARTEGEQSAAFRDAQAEVEKWQRIIERFDQERIGVEIHATDDRREFQQMFFDIADNALGITSAVKTRFDMRKITNRALAGTLDHPLVDGRVDEENDRIQGSSPYLLTMKNAAEIVRIANVGMFGRVGKVTEREGSDQEFVVKTRDFYDLLAEAIPAYQNLIVGTVSPPSLRESTLLASAPMLRVLAGVYYALGSEAHQWPREKIEGYFKTLAPHLSQLAHANSIWRNDKYIAGADEVFGVNANTLSARRQDVAKLYNAMLDWAILGKKSYPAVYAAPKAAPAPEPEVDEELLADFAADPELEGLMRKQGLLS